MRLIGQLLLDIVRLVRAPGTGAWRDVSGHLYHFGATALPITALVGFLIGVVLAYLIAQQLKQFGADAFIVNLLGMSLMRELGPMLAAILIAGRSGSAITAQIGVMRVTEELDAMRVMGIPHGYRLVMPRALALAMAMPLISVWTTMVALLGGMLAADLALGISPAFFINALPAAVDVANLSLATGKSVVFGMLIALIGCHFGLRIEPNTESLGKGTTASVVTSITVVILVDALFAIAVQGRRHLMSDAAPATRSTPLRSVVVEIRKLVDRVRPAVDARAVVVHKDLDLHDRSGRDPVAGRRLGHRQNHAAAPDSGAGAAHPGEHHACWASRRPSSTRAARPAAWACCSSRARCSRPSRVLDNIAFPLRELGRLPDDLMRDAAMVKLQMVGLEARARRQDARRSVGRHDQARGAGARPDHGPAAAAARRAHRRARPRKRRRFLRSCCAPCTSELGLTVVMVTHDLDTLLELSTRIAVLADQKVIVNGPPARGDRLSASFYPRNFFLGERGQRAMELLREYPLPYDASL